MSLKSCNKTETNTCELELTLEGDAFKAAVLKAYNKTKGKYNVPGFRKGKAPKHMIETYYGKEAFWNEAIDESFPALYEEGVKEAGISPVSDPFDAEVTDLNDNGYTVKFKVTVKPEITLKKYKGLTAEKEKVTVTKDDVKHEIEHAREHNATLVDIDDRAAETGDTANIDFEGFLDGVAFEGGKGESYDLELGSGSFIPGFEEKIVGHTIGEEFDIDVTFPEEYGEESLAGKPVVFKIKLNQLTKNELPAYDDEFVKDVSEFDTVAEYEKSIEEDIKKRREESADRGFEAGLMQALIENVEGEIPDVMVDREVDSQINEFSYRLRSQGLDYKTYLQYTGMTESDLRDNYKDGALRQVKLRLALEKIVELEKLAADDKEVEDELNKYVEMYGMKLEDVKKVVSEDDVRADLTVRKAMDLVKENAKATAPKAKKADDAEEKPAKKKAEPKAEKAPAEKKPAAKKAPAKKAEGEAAAEKKPAAKKADKAE